MCVWQLRRYQALAQALTFSDGVAEKIVEQDACSLCEFLVYFSGKESARRSGR
jgi:hypothetical protein